MHCFVYVLMCAVFLRTVSGSKYGDQDFCHNNAECLSIQRGNRQYHQCKEKMAKSENCKSCEWKCEYLKTICPDHCTFPEDSDRQQCVNIMRKTDGCYSSYCFNKCPKSCPDYCEKSVEDAKTYESCEASLSESHYKCRSNKLCLKKLCSKLSPPEKKNEDSSPDTASQAPDAVVVFGPSENEVKPKETEETEEKTYTVSMSFRVFPFRLWFG